MLKGLNPEKARIFRILHRENLPWILDNGGLHCRNSGTFDPNYIGIGNPELIQKRHTRPVPMSPRGTLSDYVPFYFTPFSPMLYNIRTGYAGIRQRPNSDILILTSSLHKLSDEEVAFLFTDRHAYLSAAQFFSDVVDLGSIDWPLLQNRDFKRDPDDPGKVERYQAEALVHKFVPLAALLGVICYSDSVAKEVSQALNTRQLALPVAAKPDWYF